MVPLYFGPQDRPLFGQYHSPGSSPENASKPVLTRGVGVVIVSPFGHEELHAHRAERHLAEHLAAAGFAVLRYDHDATGNSGGDDREGERVAAWRAGVVTAASALRERSGVSRVVLVGLRAGALLALVSAVLAEADHLVLWCPVATGRAHVRELLRLHKMLFPKPKGEGGAPEDEEALGFALRKDTAADLGKLDPLAISEKVVSGCLVVGGNDNPTEDKLLERLRSLGIETEYKHLPGHPFLVTDPHRSDVPEEMLAAITGHLTAVYKDVGEAAPAGEAGASMVTGGPCGEQAWLFGRPGKRFGVLTPPKEKGKKPAIILMNAGSIHHIGPNRAYVRMARRWADLGYPVLRMDFSGIGESQLGEGSPENVPYPNDAVKDAQAAMTALEKEGIAARFILCGLCSGADIAFRAGARDSRVAGAWMINPQAFYFESSDALKLFLDAELKAQYYESGLWDKERWKKVLRGEVNIGRVAGIMRAKVETTVKRRLSRLLGGSDADVRAESKDVIADLKKMAERGADAFLLCSEDDPGLVYLLRYFGKGLAELSRVRGFRQEVVKGTDHTFTPIWSQDLLSDMLTQHLLSRHGE